MTEIRDNFDCYQQLSVLNRDIYPIRAYLTEGNIKIVDITQTVQY